MSRLTSLESLYLMDNCLASLPSSLRCCKNLRLLYLDGNAFVIVPACIVDLPRLDRLRISYNRLKYLPAQPFFSRKTRVMFEGNPSVNYVPFNFGCRQSSLNATSAAWRTVVNAEGYENEKIVWTFDFKGCMVAEAEHHDGDEKRNGITIKWFDGRIQTLALPNQFESASVYVPSANSFAGCAVASLSELATRAVFSLAFSPSDTSVSTFLVNGAAVGRVRERTGEPRKATSFGRGLGTTPRLRLPRTLLRRLQEGPTALCAEDGCGKALFSHAAILIVTPGRRRKPNILLRRRIVLFFRSPQDSSRPSRPPPCPPLS
jgi:hypothetical protein